LTGFRVMVSAVSALLDSLVMPELVSFINKAKVVSVVHFVKISSWGLRKLLEMLRTYKSFFWLNIQHRFFSPRRTHQVLAVKGIAH
jgi:hypothetical protein